MRSVVIVSLVLSVVVVGRLLNKHFGVVGYSILFFVMVRSIYFSGRCAILLPFL